MGRPVNDPGCRGSARWVTTCGIGRSFSAAGPQAPTVFRGPQPARRCHDRLRMAYIADVIRLPLPEKLRLIFDVVAFSAVTLMVFYHFISGLSGGAASGSGTLVWTVQSFSGALVLACTVWLLASYPSRNRAHDGFARRGGTGHSRHGDDAVADRAINDGDRWDFGPGRGLWRVRRRRLLHVRTRGVVQAASLR